MKKIEAIIRSQNFANIKAQISKVGSYIIAKHNISNSEIYEKQSGSRLGSTGLKSVPLVKIELVVPDLEAKDVIKIISASSGIKPSDGGKIFVSEMTEIVDMATLEGEKELETAEQSNTKRSRLVPLQKYTLLKVEEFYEQNKESLQANYKIKSFSDFVNFCILQHLAIFEEKTRSHKSVYDLNTV
ncbi:MAG: P-II family nitrogen regulator [Candidatus Nitrosotenuis sp.]|uniref:Nitrogen regulatory protein P-II n=1 Tax=Candidatus Nitrosotenuis uzonensis TaxID=1407055 RepID=V6AQK1_9ARCH|nr:P-II family nitrogen regulator [Candidatus Nitrosotenuis uzonensis]CDI04844.1 Nitrogen regulatory protein P-II [Candidatus Nitrosotenuis uzonensis]